MNSLTNGLYSNNITFWFYVLFVCNNFYSISWPNVSMDTKKKQAERLMVPHIHERRILEPYNNNDKNTFEAGHTHTQKILRSKRIGHAFGCRNQFKKGNCRGIEHCCLPTPVAFLIPSRRRLFDPLIVRTRRYPNRQTVFRSTLCVVCVFLQYMPATKQIPSHNTNKFTVLEQNPFRKSFIPRSNRVVVSVRTVCVLYTLIFNYTPRRLTL